MHHVARLAATVTTVEGKNRVRSRFFAAHRKGLESSGRPGPVLKRKLSEMVRAFMPVSTRVQTMIDDRLVLSAYIM